MSTKRLSIRRLGKGDTIILLHGWGMNAAVFDGICSELVKTREVVSVDLPGYGASQWDGSLSFIEQAERIAYELPRGEILGWSMGGLYAMEMVRQQPAQFDRLYLTCFNPCFVQRRDWSCAVRPEVFDEFARDLKNGWEATVSRFLSLQMHGMDNARESIRETMKCLKTYGEPAPGALDFGLRLLKQQDMRALLSNIDIPVKMIFGNRDALVPRQVAEEIIQLNPKIEVESLATAAHAPFLSHRIPFLSML
ncbi:MAG: pimeloyl-ACP methyl ester esterase BioH [Gammaproteobacteria bacterium]|nr:pimeloyl-ACP methyl ester esterase BioH [Gammaproteobacteria bacterium]